MRMSPTFSQAGRVGAEFDDTADDLVAHGEGEGHAAVDQRHFLAAADVIIALPDVQIGMADAAVGDLDQHLGAFGLGGGELDFLERLAIFDDGPGAHDGGLLFAWLRDG